MARVAVLFGLCDREIDDRVSGRVEKQKLACRGAEDVAQRPGPSRQRFFDELVKHRIDLPEAPQRG